MFSHTHTWIGLPLNVATDCKIALPYLAKPQQLTVNNVCISPPEVILFVLLCKRSPEVQSHACQNSAALCLLDICTLIQRAKAMAWVDVGAPLQTCQTSISRPAGCSVTSWGCSDEPTRVNSNPIKISDRFSGWRVKGLSWLLFLQVITWQG